MKVTIKVKVLVEYTDEVEVSKTTSIDTLSRAAKERLTHILAGALSDYSMRVDCDPVISFVIED